MGTTGNEYCPWSLVVVICLIPLPTLLRVTVAPATNAPLGSLIIPEILPATSAHAVLSKKQSTTTTHESRFITDPALTFISSLLSGVIGNCSAKSPFSGKGSAKASGSHSSLSGRFGASVSTSTKLRSSGSIHTRSSGCAGFPVSIQTQYSGLRLNVGIKVFVIVSSRQRHLSCLSARSFCVRPETSLGK